MLKDKCVHGALFDEGCLLDSISSAIAVSDLRGKIVYVNKSFITLWGYGDEREILGHNVGTIWHIQGGFENLIKKLKSDKWIGELAAIDGDGMPVDAQLSAHLINQEYNKFKGIVYLFVDITRQKKVERDLKLERDRARQYLDIAPSIILALDNKGNIALLNDEGCNILECEREDVVGANWFDTFLFESQKDEVKEIFGKLMKGEAVQVQYLENIVKTARGNTKVIKWHNSLMKDIAGNISGTLSSGEDITGQKRMEHEKEKLENQLRQARKIEAIGTFAGGIAHDFNNMLNIINGYSGLLMMRLPKETDLYTFAVRIYEAGGSAANLVRQILTFSKQVEQEPRPIRLQGIIKETIKFLRDLLPATIRIHRKINPACPPILADPTQIHQVLMNLCSNAHHAMLRCGGVLDIMLDEVEIDQELASESMALAPGKYVQLSVGDTGCGMSSATIEHIYDPYFSTKKHGEGTGLGLATVYGIVKNHKGVISVDSEVDKGTIFHVYFPLAKRKPAVEQRDAARSGIEKVNARVLFVDDIEFNVSLGKHMLGLMGCETVVFTDSRRALEAFRESSDQFDLVITDQTMPYLTGYELSEKFLAIRPDIPIIMVTGHSEIVDEQLAKSLGIKRFLMKPLRFEVLGKALREVLSVSENELIS